MRTDIPTLNGKTYSLEEKVEFLRHPEAYPFATYVEVLETHMSWVFLTDQYVYKLKKPVCYDFLDFRTLEARYKYCMEEVRINQPLASDTYLGIVALKMHHGLMELNGEGEPIDWLVKMKRLPETYMLHHAIEKNKVRNEWVQQAAEMLADFYRVSSVHADPQEFRQRMVKDIQHNSTELLRPGFKLPKSLIITITTDLLHFVIKQADLFDQRIAEGKIVEGHGDLRPEHICLGPTPVIIDRVEFNKDLRIIDAAEELSFLALECEVIGAHVTGQLFLNIYKWKNHDKIPDTLISFYKAKRAFLRAKLSIDHLLEKRYQSDEKKWKIRCNTYLLAANAYCKQLPKEY